MIAKAKEFAAKKRGQRRRQDRPEPDEGCASPAKKNQEKRPSCLSPGCGREAVLRGVCWPCYHTAVHMVTAGQTTWEELESLGLVCGAHRTPSPMRAAFYAAVGKRPRIR